MANDVLERNWSGRSLHDASPRRWLYVTMIKGNTVFNWREYLNND